MPLGCCLSRVRLELVRRLRNRIVFFSSSCDLSAPSPTGWKKHVSMWEIKSNEMQKLIFLTSRAVFRRIEFVRSAIVLVSSASSHTSYTSRYIVVFTMEFSWSCEWFLHKKLKLIRTRWSPHTTNSRRCSLEDEVIAVVRRAHSIINYF